MTGKKRAHSDVNVDVDVDVDLDADDRNDTTYNDLDVRTPMTTAASAVPPPEPLPKRRRLAHAASAAAAITNATTTPTPTPPLSEQPGRDLLSPLSDELLLRILSFLPRRHLLAVAPVSRRFYRLSSDSQLWKALYYARFVLPRAMRIPGFRGGAGDGGSGSGSGHRLHYAGWGKGVSSRPGLLGAGAGAGAGAETEQGEQQQQRSPRVDWKRQYKIRHNWARGKCAVEELQLGRETGVAGAEGGRRRMLVKIAEGIAVTADGTEGLRAWDLKNRKLIAQAAIGGDGGPSDDAVPSCIAVDEGEAGRGLLDVALGFSDGSFGVWRLSAESNRLERRYRHEKSSNGELVAMAFAYPYLLTATGTVLVSLYTFEGPGATRGDKERSKAAASRDGAGKLPPPYLLTSLDSHSSRPPLALSIRKAGSVTIASVAYTFSTRRGWSIGLQDLHIHQPTAGLDSVPEIGATRIAYTPPVETDGVSYSPLSPPATPQRGRPDLAASAPFTGPSGSESETPEPGPTTLCYTHPYLLAALPDNTLILHMCTSNASSLSISDGIRLWGHTSGISDAEITARGKAVSVSTRGEEMRVWELEGRSTGVSSRSVEIRPWQSPGSGSAAGGLALCDDLRTGDPARDWDEKRNWVGFDDEMVIVLKETKGARESLMVYDFT
ncbi:uncharacterized protein P884DRAFT_332696 [Thermothelomyces heterothallicus CBS 202.75]|uniref:uncharacterized protein n=1 Tax=Thermothelomyces heterothallicus CBS 202.75 TaxID=1149848 RepID=UPI0037422BD1